MEACDAREEDHRARASGQARRQGADNPGRRIRPRGDAKPAPKRSRAIKTALEHEGKAAASKPALARQAKSVAKERSAGERSAAARKAARTKGPEERSQAAQKAARTRARNKAA